MKSGVTHLPRRPVDELPSDLAYLDENDQLPSRTRLVVEVLKQEFLDGHLLPSL